MISPIQLWNIPSFDAKRLACHFFFRLGKELRGAREARPSLARRGLRDGASNRSARVSKHGKIIGKS
jgi:hypothetical protein